MHPCSDDFQELRGRSQPFQVLISDEKISISVTRAADVYDFMAGAS